MTGSIAYVIGRYPEPSETFVRREVACLRRMGIGVTVLSLRKPAEPEEGVVYRPPLLSAATATAFLWLITHPVSCLKALGIVLRLVAAPAEMLRALRNVFAAAGFARVMREHGIGRVHAHFANMPATVGLMLARMAGAEFSFTAHAGDIYVRPTLLPLKAASATAVVACTRFNAELLRNLLPPDLHGRIKVVYHGIDLSYFTPADTPKVDPPLILSVGRLVEKKGFDVLADACGILKEAGVAFRCEIAGDGPLRAELDRRIISAGLADCVELTGRQSQAQLLDRYRAASVFALPCVIAADGDHDGLPNVLLEAAACGVPVTSTDVGGVPELIRDGETGLIVPQRDAQATAEAIRELLNDEPLRRRLSDGARREVEQRFGIEANVRRLADVLGLSVNESEPSG